MYNGFFRVAACSPRVTLADVDANVDEILALIDKATDAGVEIAVFSEMALTGYTCGDLLHSSSLLAASTKGIRHLVDECPAEIPLVLVGAPIKVGNDLYNCAVAFSRGRIYGIVSKTYLPNYNELYEKRWFAAPDNGLPSQIKLTGFDEPVTFSSDCLFRVGEVMIGVELSEDLWAPIPPSCNLALCGAQVIANLSASNDLTGKYAYLKSLLKQQSARCLCGYIYASAGFGESTTDCVFRGETVICESGTILDESDRYSSDSKLTISDVDIEAINRDRMHLSTFGDCARREASCCTTINIEEKNTNYNGNLMRKVNSMPFVPSDSRLLAERCEEVIEIQVAGLCQRLSATKCHKLILGVSGGLDSTLALLVAIRAFDSLGIDHSGIVGITMPGFGTSGRTLNNALTLMKAYGITMREISIAAAVEQHFLDIGHDISVHDVTYENSQARERTQILMDVANQIGGMVLGTGDLSELALGWATYNGDHMSMYGVNAGVPKTLVRHLVRYFATMTNNTEAREALLDIVDTPISPELIPADEKGNITQKTEDLVGPYELHDFFLYNMLRHGFGPRRIYLLAKHAFDGRFDDATIRKWLKVFFRRFFNQQFKRSCLPDGPKVGSISLSPRGDWRMPSDASSALWLNECENM